MYHCEKNNFMARLFKEFYTPELLEQKQKFYGGLGEKAS
ncbi:MAG: hypothetical protein ACI920_003950, partial [Saprospiraceae bacterium]